MGKLQERENKRKSIIGGMIDTPIAQTTSTGSRGRPKADRELKKRISLSVLPSLYDDIQKIAYVQRRSVSELLSAMMGEYRGSHAAELAEYDRLGRGKNIDEMSIPAGAEKEG